MIVFLYDMVYAAVTAKDAQYAHVSRH
jgi:hypothetical protein